LGGLYETQSRWTWARRIGTRAAMSTGWSSSVIILILSVAAICGFVIKINPVIAFLFLLRWPSLCWKWLFGWYRNIINHTIAGSEKKVSLPFCALFLFRYATCFWIVRWLEDLVIISAMRKQWFRFEIVSWAFLRIDAEFLIPLFILFQRSSHLTWSLKT